MKIKTNEIRTELKALHAEIYGYTPSDNELRIIERMGERRLCLALFGAEKPALPEYTRKCDVCEKVTLIDDMEEFEGFGCICKECVAPTRLV